MEGKRITELLEAQSSHQYLSTEDTAYLIRFLIGAERSWSEGGIDDDRLESIARAAFLAACSTGQWGFNCSWHPEEPETWLIGSIGFIKGRFARLIQDWDWWTVESRIPGVGFESFDTTSLCECGRVIPVEDGHVGDGFIECRECALDRVEEILDEIEKAREGWPSGLGYLDDVELPEESAWRVHSVVTRYLPVVFARLDRSGARYITGDERCRNWYVKPGYSWRWYEHVTPIAVSFCEDSHCGARIGGDDDR